MILILIMIQLTYYSFIYMLAGRSSRLPDGDLVAREFGDAAFEDVGFERNI